MKSSVKRFFAANGKVLLLLLAGSLIYSVGMNLFYVPAKLLSGGVAGFAQLLNYQFGLPISLMIVVINIPMFILGLRFVSRRFAIFSLIGLGIFTVSIQLFSHISLPEAPTHLTSVTLGGVLTGFGLGLIYRSGASVGGTDIISKMLHKYLSINMAVAGLVINCVIVLIAAFNYGINQAVLTICAMFIGSYVTTYVIDGIDHRRAILIVTDEKDKVAHALMEGLNRGVTVIDSYGAYTGHKNALLYCVISKHQLQRLKSLIKESDPNALFTIVTANGVYGHGQEFFSFQHIDN